jgi:hypothetical protein
MNCVVNTLIFCRQNEIPEDPEDPEVWERAGCVREGGMGARGRDVCARAGMGWNGRESGDEDRCEVLIAYIRDEHNLE